MPEKLGLIAGDGIFAREIASAALKKGCQVHAVGFYGLTREDLSECTSAFSWHHLGQVEGLLEDLRKAGVRSLVMAGKIDKSHLMGIPGEILRPDARAARILESVCDWSDATLMRAIADLLESEGFLLLPQTEYVPDLLAPSGTLGALCPSPEQKLDLAYGWPIARKIADAGIGQCIVVKDRAVVAVEALEGSDATIKRAVELVGGTGVSVIKLAESARDPRFDLPAVGPDTLSPLMGGDRSLLAIEAGSTVILERDEMIARADEQGIAVVACNGSDKDCFHYGEGSLQQ